MLRAFGGIRSSEFRPKSWIAHTSRRTMNCFRESLHYAISVCGPSKNRGNDWREAVYPQAPRAMAKAY